jgi:hypothetical protein
VYGFVEFCEVLENVNPIKVNLNEDKKNSYRFAKK